MSQKSAKRKRKIPVFENEWGELIPLKTIQRIQKATDKINQQRRDTLAYYSNNYWYKTADQIHNKLPNGGGEVKLTLADKAVMSMYEDYPTLQPLEFHPETLRAENAKKMLKSREFQTTKKYKHEMQQNYKRNMIETIESTIGTYDPAKAKEIIKEIRKTSGEKLEDLYYRNEIVDITYIYEQWAIGEYEDNPNESITQAGEDLLYLLRNARNEK